MLRLVERNVQSSCSLVRRRSSLALGYSGRSMYAIGFSPIHRWPPVAADGEDRSAGCR
jgi:hypothetical protein